ncbi:piezo-type mechanosensitive ion channel component 1 [Puma concolor]|uniref:Piezo-type mechanosensitive ion channel component 1 n=1 Tax=Puma concolor TaxID=9696 RepID=A0A6P6HMM7_PUMCO|nr:piezo-type mechanosensitive ion channel component 1 [Puma concolor]
MDPHIWKGWRGLRKVVSRPETPPKPGLSVGLAAAAVRAVDAVLGLVGRRHSQESGRRPEDKGPQHAGSRSSMVPSGIRTEDRASAAPGGLLSRPGERPPIWQSLLGGHTGRLLRALLLFSLLFLAAHLAFQICLHTVPRLDQLLGPSCSPWQILSQHVGVTRLDLKDIPNAVRLVAPDLGVLVVSAVCLGLCGRLAREARRSQPAQEQMLTPQRLADTFPGPRPAVRGSPTGSRKGAGSNRVPLTVSSVPPFLYPRGKCCFSHRTVTAHWLLVAAGRTLAILLLALAGIAQPSAFSGVYFLVFLATCTWQDAVSGTPLLQEEEEVAREEGLSGAGPQQAVQVPEGESDRQAKWGLVAERLLDLADRFSEVLTCVQVLVRRLLELHVLKLVALYTVWVALKEVSVMNLLLVVLWAFALPYPRFRPMASCLSTVWTCIIIVCKMLYQLKVVSPHEYSSNCTEICFLMAVNVIGQRMNFMVILHGCWLVAILTRRHRGAIARLWPNYCLFLALFFLYQYLLCLGIPPALCLDYPWRWSQAIPMNSALIKWLYLPDFFRTPNSTNLISERLRPGPRGRGGFKHSAATDITSSLSDDQVPEAFLVMLLIQFSTMVIDRALYLRKTVLGKLAFQVVLVLAIHLWMFLILPAVTERMFSQNAVAQLWYFVKCVYFALSAYQIRCGYPTRILGNFLTKKYNHLNLFLFQGFRLVPFLVELRAVMDWVWTDTTLSLSSWMCVEDIYANIFIIKCSRETEKKYPQPKGQKKKKVVKYGMGGLIILFLVAIIWFPLLFMSLVRSVVGVVNQPIDVTVTLKLGGYEPLFTMSAQQPSIVPFTQQAYEELSRHFDPNPLAMQFISQYSPEDIVTAQIEGSSGALWRISPPSRAQMKRELYNGTADITLRFTWNFQRDLAKGGTVEYTNEKHTLDLAANSSERRQLASLLEGTSDQSVVIPNLFPKYIRAPNGPEANPVKQLQPNEEADYLGVRIQLRRERVGSGAAGFLEWWVIELQDCQAECNLLPMVIFSDKVSPPSLGFLAGYGIMGLYVSIVLVIGKFVRGFFSEISHSIMFEELPCVDRILKLCQDIFLVRETRELELEEELYAKLIFLYRSPETMIKWTREKE